MAVTAWRRRSFPTRASAILALRVSRARGQLRRQVTQAERTGAHLGDVPTLLPRLQTAGDRISCSLLHQQAHTLTPSGRGLLDEAQVHLSLLADLSDAVRTSTLLPEARSDLTRDAADAAQALRCYTAAYQELISPAAPLLESRG